MHHVVFLNIISRFAAEDRTAEGLADGSDLIKNFAEFCLPFLGAVSIRKKLRFPDGRIVVERQGRIFIGDFMNTVELHRKVIALEKEDMVLIHITDGLCDISVKIRQKIRRINQVWLVQDIIAEQIFTVTAVFGNFCPERNHLIAEYFVMPELRNTGCIVGMPVRVLPARGRVEIRQKIDLIRIAQIEQTVKIDKALFQNFVRVLVVEKKMIIERNAEHVDTAAL